MAAATATWNFSGRCPMVMVDAVQNEESSPYHPRARVGLGMSGASPGRNPWRDRTGGVRERPGYLWLQSLQNEVRSGAFSETNHAFLHGFSHAGTWKLERAGTRVQPGCVPQVAQRKSSAKRNPSFRMRRVQKRTLIQGQSCRRFH